MFGLDYDNEGRKENRLLPQFWQKQPMAQLPLVSKQKGRKKSSFVGKSEEWREKEIKKLGFLIKKVRLCG